MIAALSAEKRNSINPKISDALPRLSRQITPPPISRTKMKSPDSSIVGQLFLCAIGTLLSVSVCIWLAFFSSDLLTKRMIWASAAAGCAAVFTLLAMVTIRRNKKDRDNDPEIEISPTALMRQRRSLTNGSLRRNTRTGEDLLLSQPTPTLSSSVPPSSDSNNLSVAHRERGLST